MKATSHFAMAHLLCATLQKRGVYLDRIAFVYGNIEPDQTPAMWFHPHFRKFCSRSIASITEELAEISLSSTGRVGAYYSKELGMLCHYICDYFCFAHNEEFSGSIKQHIAYENDLDTYLRRDCLNLLDMDGSDKLPRFSSAVELAGSIEAAHGEYINSEFSLQSDLRFAFDACVTAIINIVAISKSRPAASFGAQMEDFMNSLKGYATGHNLVFRMFMFKYRNHNLFFLPELMPPIGAYS